MNASELLELDFNSDEFCFAGKTSWICQGDGVSDKSMSFVAMPSAAARAINGMTYESLRPNIHDNITVTFYDGEVRTGQTDRQIDHIISYHIVLPTDIIFTFFRCVWDCLLCCVVLQGGDCLSSGQQSAMTFTEGCFTSRADVSVSLSISVCLQATTAY